jgi:hypothetical protein
VEEASWFLPIVIVPKNNGNLRICVDFQGLNAITKKDPYPLAFIEEVLDEVVGHEVYLFLDGFSSYHQIMITQEDRYNIVFIIRLGSFCLGSHAIWVQKCSTNLSTGGEYSFQRLSWSVHEIILG